MYWWTRAGVALVVLAAVPFGRAYAWNAVGHMTVAKLAYDQMDKDLKSRVDKLLRQHPHYGEYLANNAPAGVDLGEWAFLRASTWPDWIRPNVNKKKGETEDPRGARVVKYHRGNDHFVNVPIIHPGDEKLFEGKTLIPPDKTDIVVALRQRLDDMMTNEAPAADKAVALCWLLHLIGDIHQPLHCATLFSAVFKTGDLGGNAYAIRADDRPQRLHSYWDELLGVEDYTKDTPEENTKRYKLVEKAVGQLRGPQFAAEKFPQLKTNTSFASWVGESTVLAKEKAYGKLTAKQVVAPFNGPLPMDAEPVGDAYDQMAHAIANQQVALAGHRLGERLRQLKKYLPK
jgi:hypothetical protein